MPKKNKLWRIKPTNFSLKRELSSSLGISEVIAQVLINRGITDTSTARDFLLGDKEKLGDPYLLKDMHKAVERIAQTIQDKQKIVVYGDYDVDGMTASALMYKVLKKLGAVIDYYIPERQTEGYGLNSGAIEKLAKSGTNLLITVDCGISSIEEVSNIKGKLDIIITDHHQPPECLPDAYAIINPKQKECQYPEKNLAGVGVAFKLCQALWQHYYGREAIFLEYMDIVSIGTVADIVSLTGENRILVKLGLREIANNKNIGLNALMEVCGIDSSKINAGKIGFGIGPRLNAAGRVSRADYGVELLITQDAERAKELAINLDTENSHRQTIEKDIQIAAEKLISEIDLNTNKVLVLTGDNWHPGVIGIVASRLVEKYYRPVIMISIREGVGKASCRSIPAFDIYNALCQCSDLLVQFGGHHQAAGLSVLPEHIDELISRMNKIATNVLTEDDYIPIINIDTVVSLDEIDSGFLEQLACLEPYGMGNYSPVFACEDLILKDIRTMGQDGRHLKLKVSQKNITNDVVAWQMGGLAENLLGENNIDLAFFPEINEWQGKRNIQLRAYDVRNIESTDIEKLYILNNDIEHKSISIDDCFANDLDTIIVNNSKLMFHDKRNITDKFGYLLKLLELQEKTIIFVNTPQEACELAKKIRMCLPEIKDKVGMYHSGLNAEWRGKIETYFKQDILNVVVATNVIDKEFYTANVKHVLLYSLPLNMRTFVKQCCFAGASPELSDINLIFGNKDIAANHVLLNHVAPERTTVGQIYVVIKNSNGTITDDQVVNQVFTKYKATVSKYAVNTAIRILAELNLLQQEIAEGKRTIHLLPAPQEKLNIEESETFRQGMLKKDTFKEFAEKIMSVPISEILLLMNQ